MSQQALEQFIQKVTGSEELQTRIGDEIDVDSLIALGAENGCEFTVEDLQEGVRLSDGELDEVAGGDR
jgi:predicted ribosomally synthesized peptide with nif11-like leader